MDDFKANPSNLVSFVKKIVNKSSDTSSGGSGAAGGSSSSSSRGRSSRSPSVPFFARNSIASTSSRYSSPSTLRRASRAAETLGSSVPAPSLNFKQIKDKVASGSSKVLSTLKGSDSSSSPSYTSSHRPSSGGGVASAMAASAIAAVAATASAGAPKPSSSSLSAVPSGAMARRYSSVVRRTESGDDAIAKKSRVTKLNSQPTLSNPPSSASGNEVTVPPEQLMSHLTEEERSILSKVFLKEEQFKRESNAAAYKQGNLSKLGSSAIRKLSRVGQDNSSGQVVTSSSLTTMSNLTSSPLDSPASSVTSTSDLSLATRTTMSTGQFGTCRICRKNLDSGEKYHYCNSCSGTVCEDCSSYVSQSGKFFMCSSCRRKSSAIPDSLATDPGFLRRRSTMVSREPGLQGHFDPSQRRPSDSPSSMESPIPPQSESPSFRDSRESMFRDGSTGRFSADGTSASSRGCDSTMSNTSSRSGGHGTVRSSSGEGHHVFRSGSAEGQRSRRSLTASDSSPEEETGNDPYLKSSFVNRRRFSSQSSFDHDQDPYNSYQTSQSSVVRRPSNVSATGGNMLTATTTSGLRSAASEIFLSSYTGQNKFISEVRRKSDSPSSDMTCDTMMRQIGPNSPPNECSMSSPDWTRSGSPRQSGDSEQVLQLPASMGQFPQQRRSIPSVLVDPNSQNATGLLSEELNYLSLKDCFGRRRSSTGRALPQIPVEQSRSLLDLPGGGRGSSHSLDLPHDQPRRASAPEGENIRIVIDDVDSSGLRNGRSSSSQGRVERVILHRDHYDKVDLSPGFGLFVTGGKFDPNDGRLYTYVEWVTPSGPADKMGLKPGDKILEWDGTCLVNCSLEQVLRVIESSSNTAELLIDPLNRDERKGYFIHQRRRLSTQTSISLENSCNIPGIGHNLSHSSEELMSSGRPGGRRLPRPPGTPTMIPTTTPSLAIVTLDPDILIDFND